MNIVNRLTLKHLRLNKRRTLVTIIGVIIAVAMITAVTTLGVSFLDLFIRDEINRNGEWHVIYENVNTQQIDAIREDENTGTVFLSRNRGLAFIGENPDGNKFYLSIKEFSGTGFEKYPVKLTVGRLPQKENEVVISESVIKKSKVNYQPGDEITVDIGEIVLLDTDSGNNSGGNNNKSNEAFVKRETAAFKVVGIMKPPAGESATRFRAFGFIDESGLTAGERVDASVVLKKIRRSLYSDARKLADRHDIESVNFNDNLLRFYGVTRYDNLRQTFTGLLSVIMGIIIIGAVALIYNSFAISVGERSRYLGMLSSVGATRIQKRNSVFFEGAVIGLISIPIGILSGLGGLGITFFLINKNKLLEASTSEKLLVKVTPMSLVLACAVSILTIFISTYMPALRASRISAIDAIRQATDFRITRKTVKTSRLVRMLFGIEAEIGLKNLKRNRKRYKATIFSIVISIVLFLSISFFTENFRKSIQLTRSQIQYDIEAILDWGVNADTDLKDWLNSRKEISEYAFMNNFACVTWLDEKMVPEKLRKKPGFADDTHGSYNSGVYRDGKYFCYLYINYLDDEALKRYAERAGADFDRLTDPGVFTGILINRTTYRDYEAGKFVEVKTSEAKAGDKLDVYMPGSGRNAEDSYGEYIDQIEVTALSGERPEGVYEAGTDGLSIIVSEETFEQLAIKMGITLPRTRVYIKSTDPLATEEAMEDRPESFSYIQNHHEDRKQNEKVLLFELIFTYGFITLITLISIANIFNTISTSIALRRREFAMLRSVGMTPRGFSKMINYESIFYGIKALLYGLPLSGIAMLLLYRSFTHSFYYDFALPWNSIVIAVAAVFVIVGTSMLYSGAKIKKENILDAMRQENI